MTYVYKCTQCDVRIECPQAEETLKHLHEASGHAWVKMVRDYRTENAGTSLENLRKARE